MESEKIFLILGASSDVGTELIDYLNHRYAKSVFLAHYHSSDDNLKKIDMVNQNQLAFFKADLEKHEEVVAMNSKIKEQYGIPTHIVHLAAAKFEYIKLKDFQWEQCLRDLEIQVHSLLEVLNTFLPKMSKRDCNSKVVVMLSSNTISSPPKFTLQYNLVKYMLLGLVKSLAADYAGKSVNINAVSPSMIDTKFLSNIDPRMLEINNLKDNMADVKQIVPVIEFLLSESSNFLHGVNINVTNGQIM